jgi:predicted small secreted protein
MVSFVVLIAFIFKYMLAVVFIVKSLLSASSLPGCNTMGKSFGTML